MPRPLGSQGTYQVEDKRFRIAVPYPASAAAEGDGYFFPATDGILDYAAPQKVVRDGDRVVDTVRHRPAAEGPIDGVLAFGTRAQAARSALPARASRPAESLATAGGTDGGGRR